MTIKEFFSFKQNKFFWINLIAMVIVVALVLFGVLKGLDIYTRHGEAVVVPNVKGMGVAEAEKMFRNQGLTCFRLQLCKELTSRMHPRTQSCRRAESERRTHHLSDHKHPEYPFASRSRCSGQQFHAPSTGTPAGGRLQTVRERTHSRRKRLGIRCEI